MKPLATNGLDLRNTLLVDNEGTKACQGEELNLLLLPTWAACFGAQGGDEGNAAS